MYRRTWPRVRTALADLRAAERDDPATVRRRSLGQALATARRAAERSPLLRELYREAGVTAADLRGDDVAALRALPPLTKEILRAHADDIVCDDADRSDLVRGATGGSTGVPSPYFHDTEWWCCATAAAMRGDEWTGWRTGERVASVWGTPLEETRRARLRRTVLERARNFLFLPGFDLSPDVLERKLEEMYAFRPRLVTGYASLLRAAAEGILASGRRPLRPLALVSSAEPLPPETRATVERAFGAPVYDRYGCRELGIVAQECEQHDGLHVVLPHVWVEIDVDGRPAAPGETGRLLITLLDNDSFPMVRYEVGDLATAGDDSPCPCGLSYPRLRAVEGRILDVLWNARGGALTGVFLPSPREGARLGARLPGDPGAGRQHDAAGRSGGRPAVGGAAQHPGGAGRGRAARVPRRSRAGAGAPAGRPPARSRVTHSDHDPRSAASEGTTPHRHRAESTT